MSEPQTTAQPLPAAPAIPKTNHAIAVAIGIAGIAMGLAGDLLLRDQKVGINWLLITLLIIVAMHVIAWRERIVFAGEGYWLLMPLVVLSSFVAWRDSSTLTGLNILAWLCVMALITVRARSGTLRDGGILRYILDGIVTGIAAAVGAFGVLLNGINWQRLHVPQVRHGSAIVRGLVLSVPIVLVFCALFAAADAVFAQWVNRLTNFDVDLSNLFEHVIPIGFYTWIAIGVFWLMFTIKVDYSATFSRPTFMRLGMIEVGIVLGLLNLLFAAFVIIQIRYLFGGVTQLNLDDNLTYAQYARRGFFELVTVAALLLPTLLLAHWLLQPQDQTTTRRFQTLAGGLLMLLIAVMASAVQRMRLYQQEYGLTELRFYTSVFMGWLAVIFGWFAWTVLRNRRSRFMFGVLVSGLIVLLGLNAVNPDALIVRTNADRAQPIASSDGERVQRNDFDGLYASSLSADAVPALIDNLDLMLPDEQCRTAAQLLNQFNSTRDDWRSWNWSRQQARAAVQANRAMLQEMACPLDR